jgi:hypothetical protein
MKSIATRLKKVLLYHINLVVFSKDLSWRLYKHSEPSSIPGETSFDLEARRLPLHEDDSSVYN